MIDIDAAIDQANKYVMEYRRPLDGLPYFERFLEMPDGTRIPLAPKLALRPEGHREAGRPPARNKCAGK